MLKTVDEVCDFIAEWCGEPDSHAGPPLVSKVAVPDCVVRLNARLGGLWRTARREPVPCLKYATPFEGVLGGQDEILNPREYAQDDSGIVAFVYENQGVWSYGFDPDEADQLLVSGDWHDGPRWDFKTEWHRVAAKVEDALICTLLTNLCSQSDADRDGAKPEAAHVTLWQHPAWDTYYHFWTDDQRTMICFGGTTGDARSTYVVRRSHS